MNNDRNDEQFRFDKLYQLLGDEVNQIYDDKSNSVFLNDQNTTTSQEVKKEEVIFSDNEEVFAPPVINNNVVINNLRPIISEIPKVEESTEIPDEVEESTDEVQIVNNEVSSQEQEPVNDIFNIFNDAPNDSEYYQELNTPPESLEPVSVHIDNNIIQEVKEEPISIDTITENVDNNPVVNTNVVRNKTLINKREFNDGLDEIDDGKKSFIDIITSRNTILILAIIAVIVVGILTIKIFHFGRVVDIYNEYTTEREKPGSDTNVYGGDEIDSETLRKVAATELIDCIKSPIDTNELPESITSIINEMNAYYKKSDAHYAFAYKDIFTGFTVTYNESGNIFAASTIKAPVNIYLYEKASKDELDLDKELTYTGNYYTDGTGVLKNEKFNSKYTMRTLSQYAIRNSDNIAHNMLMDELGRKNVKNFWLDKGTNIILTGNDNWGLINAHDAMIYMKELYTFYINNEEYGTELMDNFLNAKTKFITSPNSYKIANKSGWSGFAQHDVAIVFADNPYILVALSNLGYDNSYMSYFNKASSFANSIHQEYWKYKMNKCSNIKQHD